MVEKWFGNSIQRSISRLYNFLKRLCKNHTQNIRWPLTAYRWLFNIHIISSFHYFMIITQDAHCKFVNDKQQTANISAHICIKIMHNVDGSNDLIVFNSWDLRRNATFQWIIQYTIYNMHLCDEQTTIGHCFAIWIQNMYFIM